MATNRFFDNANLSVTDGTLAKAIQLNNLLTQTNTAFEIVESEIDSLGTFSSLSYEWATNDQGVEIDPTNYPGEYSSRANAEESKAWAVGTGGVSTEADGVTKITSSSKEERVLAQTAKADAEQAVTDCGAILASVTTEGNTQVARVLSEGNTQDARVTSEGDTQDARVTSEGDTQVARVLSEGDTQEARVISEGTTQVGLAAAQVALAASEATDSANSADDSLEWAEAPVGTGAPGASSGSSKAWAETAEDSLVDGVGYSSKHHATKSAASAAAALTSEGLASGYADDAADSATEAATIVNIGIIASTNMSLVSNKTLDASTADVFDLYSIDTNFTITLSGMSAGRTITIFMDDAVGHVTWPAGIYWLGGAEPELTAEIDCIVLTQLSSSRIIGSAALEHATV